MKKLLLALALLLTSTASYAICNSGNQTFTFPINAWMCMVECNRYGDITGGECLNPNSSKVRRVEGGQLYDLYTSGLLTPIRTGQIILNNTTITVLGIQAGSQNSAGGGWISHKSGAYGKHESGMNYYSPRR